MKTAPETTFPSPQMSKLAKQIGTWRQHREKLEPMPRPLWERAIELARHHGVGPTARLLEIDFGALKRRVEGSQGGQCGLSVTSQDAPETLAASPTAEEAVHFLELGAFPMAAQSGPAETSVELSRPDGAQMTVRLSAGSALDLGGLVTSFLGGGR